jgi:site-specific recombinase XerD
MRNRFYMILMYDTAGRCQELLDLKLKDFVISGSKPYVYLTGKNSRQRSVPLLPKTVGHYEHYLAAFHPEPNSPDDYVFYTVSHNQRHQMSEDNVEAFMKKYGEQARKGCHEVPLRVHPHQLRHTRAMHLYRSGWPLPFVSELLGHAKITTTNIYAYADTEMKRNALSAYSISPSSLAFSSPHCQR